jgi:GntR family transcriptional repressor for pyruvate dehydrogenase complex
MFSSVRTPRVYEHIATEIERAIDEGRLASGDKLPPERQLVREFRASRVAVREALRALEHRGLVEVRQGSAGGHFIREVDTDLLFHDLRTLLRLGRVSVGQLLEARMLIEPEMARLAALRATPLDLKSLDAVLEERSEATAAGTHRRVLDIDFHRRVAEAAKNPVHAFVTHALMDLEAEVVVPHLELTPADNAQVDVAHRAIRDAIVARRPEAAQAAMLDHIVGLQRRLQRAEIARQPVAGEVP